MIKQRTASIDIFRTFALLLVLIYHCWVLTGSIAFSCESLNMIVSLGGEIGVTAFFALSGYGIYYSIYIQDIKHQFVYKEFLRKRCKRIMPQYYFCIFIAVFFMYGGAYVSLKGLLHIGAHMIFLHNLFPQTHGSINGVLWTMGVTFQFYLISYFLYKGMRKWGSFFEVVCVMFTVIAKAVMYIYVLPCFNVSNQLEFFGGRQLFTALDNFTVGMFVAYLENIKEWHIKKIYSYLGILVGFGFLYIICYYGRIYGIHTNNISGYTWHSFLALGIGIIIFFCSRLECNCKNWIVSVLLWISKYEYGIYLWHLLIINTWIQESSIVQYFLNKGLYLILYILFVGVSLIVGFVFSVIVDSYVNNRKVNKL